MLIFNLIVMSKIPNMPIIHKNWIEAMKLYKYQSGGNLVYTPLLEQEINKDKQDNFQLPLIENEYSAFPVEPVKITAPHPVVWDPQEKLVKPKPRGTAIFKHGNIDVGNMRELLDKFEEAGISVRVTSGKESRKTKQGKESKHSYGDAIDITPIEGQTYDDLKNQIMNSPELLAYMRDNEIGIIDETDPWIKRKTGATGDHWHISRRERYALAGFNKLFA